MPERTSVYEAVTRQIIAELEQGTVPWVKPWLVGLPQNAVSQRPYSGVNILLLWHESNQRSYRNRAWLTFKQALSLGGSVRKGEKSSRIVYASTFTKTVPDEVTQEKAMREISFLKWYRVFNVEQTHGLPEHLYVVPEPQPFTDRQAEVEAFLDRAGVDVRHGHPLAAYHRVEDFVALPNPQDFRTPEDYFATRLHETGHWTGHRSRLARDLSGRFGSDAYAMEELTAELTSAFASAELGIQAKLQHAPYIQVWLRVLREDSRAIFTAARRATEAAYFLHGNAETLPGSV